MRILLVVAISLVLFGLTACPSDNPGMNPNGQPADASSGQSATPDSSSGGS